MANIPRRISPGGSSVASSIPLPCTDEGAAVEFMASQRWGDTPTCPHCEAMNVYRMVDAETRERNRRYLWRCRGCKRQFTVRIGTVFEESRIPLRHWCYAFWRACTSKRGVTALEIERQTGVSYKSALFMMDRIRLAMTIPDADKLAGTIAPDATYRRTERG